MLVLWVLGKLLGWLVPRLLARWAAKHFGAAAGAQTSDRGGERGGFNARAEDDDCITARDGREVILRLRRRPGQSLAQRLEPLTEDAVTAP